MGVNALDFTDGLDEGVVGGLPLSPPSFGGTGLDGEQRGLLLSIPFGLGKALVS